MKVTEQYFFVVLFIMLYKVALAFDAVDKILKCDHSHESYWAVLSCGAVCYGVQGSSNFESVDKILKFDHSNENCWAVLSWYVVQFIVIVMYKVILIFESVNETLRCDLSNENLGILPFTWKFETWCLFAFELCPFTMNCGGVIPLWLMHFSSASPRGEESRAVCGGIGHFVGTLQQIWTSMVGEIYDTPSLRETGGLGEGIGSKLCFRSVGEKIR